MAKRKGHLAGEFFSMSDKPETMLFFGLFSGHSGIFREGKRRRSESLEKLEVFLRIINLRNADALAIAAAVASP
jgi:hypothetical protein